MGGAAASCVERSVILTQQVDAQRAVVAGARPSLFEKNRVFSQFPDQQLVGT